MESKLKVLLQQFSKEFTPILIAENETLIRQNTEADCAYLVVTGRVHAILETEDNTETIVAEIGPGETVGEMSLLTGRLRSTTVRAARDSELLRISKTQFEKILFDHPDVLLELTRNITLRLDRTTRLRQISFKPKNILVMPAGSDESLFRHHAQKLAEALSRRGKVKVLDFDVLKKEIPRFSELSERGADLDSDSGIIQWFNNSEDEYDFVVYVSNTLVDWWTKRCIRTADRIFMTGNSLDSELLNPIERHVKEAGSPKTLRQTELILVHPQGQKVIAATDRWLKLRKVSRYRHLQLESSADYQREVRFLLGEAFGLVLGGGGARGLAHVGVMKAMQELQIPIDMIGGTSIGSLFAGLHCLGLSPDEQLAVVTKYSNLYTPYHKYTLPLISLLRPTPTEDFYKAIFGAAKIEDSNTDYFCISCNLNTAQRVVHENGFFWEAVRASTSIPGVYPPTLAEHSLLIDGGIMDNLPALEMKKRGASTVVVVDVAPRNDLQLDSNLKSIPSAWEALRTRFKRGKEKSRFPSIMEILMRTLMVNSVSHRKEAEAVADLLLCPPPGKVGLMDFSSMGQVADSGYAYAKPLLEAFKKTLPPLIALAIMLLSPSASQATLFGGSYDDLLAKSQCVAFVHVTNQESFRDTPGPGGIHSVFESEVLDSAACGNVRIGDTLYFAAPGGIIGDHATRVSGIDVEPGQEVTVYLSAPSSLLGVPMLLRSDSKTVAQAGQTSAYTCWRVPTAGPSLFWANRTVKMNASLSNDPTLSQSDLIDAMQWAAQQWSSTTCSDFKFEVGSPTTQRWVGYDWSQKHDNFNLVTVRKSTKGDFYSEWIHESDALALTSLTYIFGTGEIVDADIELNADVFQFTNCETSTPGCVTIRDLKNTLTHEFGHVLGLYHPPVNLAASKETTMYSESQQGETKKRTLAADDINGLCFIYPKAAETRECFSVKRRDPSNISVKPGVEGCTQTNSHQVSVSLTLLALIFFIRTLFPAKARKCLKIRSKSPSTEL